MVPSSASLNHPQPCVTSPSPETLLHPAEFVPLLPHQPPALICPVLATNPLAPALVSVLRLQYLPASFVLVRFPLCLIVWGQHEDSEARAALATFLLWGWGRGARAELWRGGFQLHN